MTNINPYTDEWTAPAGSGHKFLIKYMLALQQDQYQGTILDMFSYAILTRNMKLLYKEFTEDELKRGIAMAAWVCDHPFSTKQVKECIRQWQKEYLSCEVLNSTRNKS